MAARYRYNAEGDPLGLLVAPRVNAFAPSQWTTSHWPALKRKQRTSARTTYPGSDLTLVYAVTDN